MKVAIAVTIADSSHFAHVGGEVVRTTSIVDLDFESLPTAVRQYLVLRDNPQYSLSASLSFVENDFKSGTPHGRVI